MSIVIVNWNAGPWLEACLSSLAAELERSAPLSAEIFVVDNASTDDSLEVVRSRYPEVRLIENPTNRGFAAATNQGIRRSSGGAVLLLNPDTEVRAGAVDSLVRYLREHREAAAVAPRLVDDAGRLQKSTSSFPTLRREIVSLFHLERPLSRGSEHRSLTAAHAVDVLQGACVLLRKRALDEIGLLDEAYFMYSEEVDLLRRLHDGGWTAAWLPTAVVVHHGGRSTEQIPERMFLELYRSKILFFRKHRGATAARIYKLILAAAALTRLSLLPLSMFEPSARRHRHRALGWCYAQLLRHGWRF